MIADSGDLLAGFPARIEYLAAKPDVRGAVQRFFAANSQQKPNA